jgi:hypothetical protein
MSRLARALLSAIVLSPAAASAQATLVYRLGSDTVGVEQYTRTATRLAGALVTRTGGAVVRTEYEIALANGRAVTAVVRRRQADGAPLPNAPTEYRFAFSADSVRRDLVWPDSTQSRALAARGAVLSLPVPGFGPTELMAIAARRPGARSDSLTGVGLTGNPTRVGLELLGGDTTRLVGGFYPMLMRFDAEGRLLMVDGSLTTNKITATRTAGTADIAALARGMRPMGAASGRATARAGIRTGGIVMVDYGRPQVRDRTVWGGTLVPYDSIWRTGANDATHLATTRDLAFGDVVVPAGVYTLWVQHTRTGTWLMVSRQVGVWGTVYDAAQVLGRVPLELSAAPAHVEEFTIEVRATGMNRGVLEFAWGPSVASTGFVMR